MCNAEGYTSLTSEMFKKELKTVINKIVKSAAQNPQTSSLFNEFHQYGA